MKPLNKNDLKKRAWLAWLKLNLRDKLSFTYDLVKSSILKGKEGVVSEIHAWEESIELMENPKYDERITEIQRRMADSVK